MDRFKEKLGFNRNCTYLGLDLTKSDIEPIRSNFLFKTCYCNEIAYQLEPELCDAICVYPHSQHECVCTNFKFANEYCQNPVCKINNKFYCQEAGMVECKKNVNTEFLEKIPFCTCVNGWFENGKCACPESFSGDLCEFELSSNASGSDHYNRDTHSFIYTHTNPIIITSAVMALVIIVGIIAWCEFFKKRERYVCRYCVLAGIPGSPTNPVIADRERQTTTRALPSGSTATYAYLPSGEPQTVPAEVAEEFDPFNQYGPPPAYEQIVIH